jgi:FixJ family two-component response regulator
MYQASQLSRTARNAHLAAATAGREGAVADAARRPWNRPDGPSCDPAAPVVLVVSDDLLARAVLETVIVGAGWSARIMPSDNALLTRSGAPVPTCLVLDLPSLEAASQLRERPIPFGWTDMPVICLTAQGDVAMTVRAMKAGAVDVLCKPVQAGALRDAIGNALDLSTAALRRGSEARQLQGRYETLSDRERQVMNLVVSGLLNKQVGGELGISEVTVKAHRGRVMRKMQARTLAGLVRMAGSLQLA